MTVPVGVPLALTVAVNVTFCPTVDGLGLDVSDVVVELNAEAVGITYGNDAVTELVSIITAIDIDNSLIVKLKLFLVLPVVK